MIVNSGSRGTLGAYPHPPRPSRIDRWIPWIFAAFALVVLAANGAMIAIALSTWPGLETADAYNKGLAHNQTLEAARAQAALGWRAELAFAQTGERKGRLELRLEDAASAPIERADVRASLIRPAQHGHDFDMSLEPRGNGLYAGEVVVPLPGIWNVRLRIEGRQQVFRLQQRIVVR
jgi:nitrogen fixation protein FixH